MKLGPFDRAARRAHVGRMRTPPRIVPLLLALLVAAPLSAQVDRITGRAFATRSEVIARNGMVCTSQPLATQVGRHLGGPVQDLQLLYLAFPPHPGEAAIVLAVLALAEMAWEARASAEAIDVADRKSVV